MIFKMMFCKFKISKFKTGKCMVGKFNGPWALPLLFALVVIASTLAPALVTPQKGVPPQGPPQEPPKQQGPTPGAGSSGSKVPAGAIVGAGAELVNILRQRHAAPQVHLGASTQQAQVGQPVTFTTTVTPAGGGLSYEFHWAKDFPGVLKDSPTVSHAYDKPGQYQAMVVVYDKNKKPVNSNGVTITVLPPVSVAAEIPPVQPAPNKAPPDPIKVAVAPPAVTPPPPSSKPTPVESVSNPAPSTTNPATANSEPPKRQNAPAPVQQNANGAPARLSSPLVPVQAQTPNQHDSAEIKSGALAEASAPTPYCVSLHVASRTEAGKPANFRAELDPKPTPEKPVRYCFSWGDGGPASCQESSVATHVYRFRGKYLASVDVLSDQATLAAAIPIQIEAVLPMWLKIWTFLALVLALLAAGYGTHRARRMVKGSVRVKTDPGRNKITPVVVDHDAGFHIHCVRPPAVSKITYSSPDPVIQEDTETAHA